MAKEWKCGHCLKELDPRKDVCGREANYRGPCPLWWFPATIIQRLRCSFFKCACPFGRSLCFVCRPK